MEVVRKKSPRAPSISLEEALQRALAAYDKDRLHPAPTEVVAQHLGYKSANNGSALTAIASLRYYGLLERPKEGMLAVSKAVETYKYTPDEAHRRELLIKFLRTPALFDELLQQYKTALPSDATIRYELITRGFLPGSADACAAVFRKSVEFTDYFKFIASGLPDVLTTGAPSELGVETSAVEKVAPSDGLPSGQREHQSDVSPSSRTVLQVSVPSASAAAQTLQGKSLGSASGGAPFGVPSGEGDCIPIRLSGGRRAWLVVPEQFYEADKIRLKAQIDLLLTAEQDQSLE